MGVRRRRRSWSPGGTVRRVVKPRVGVLLQTAAGAVRLVGWLYVAVLIPALLIVSYLVVREVAAGGEVLRSLRMLALVMIWPLAAIALRGDAALALRFPMNAVVLVGSVAFVITGWAVLIRFVRGLVRSRAAR